MVLYLSEEAERTIASQADKPSTPRQCPIMAADREIRACQAPNVDKFGSIRLN